METVRSTVVHVTVDVQTSIEIDRPRAVIAAFASDPDNATRWYSNIESVEWRTPRSLKVGSRVAFVAHFMGRRLSYIYEVREFVEGERFVMSTQEGPFPMETTYSWRDAGSGGTHMELRNRGEPSGFSKLVAPLIRAAIRRANNNDLARLKAVLEAENRSH
jgi:Polyketide cyclase / dehydrase and lipid transport